MKKTLLTAVVVCASVFAAVAQEQNVTTTSNPQTAPGTEQKAAAVVKAQEWQKLVVTELKLTDEQQKKIAEMDKAFGERRQAIHNNPDLTDEQKKERKMALLKAREAQFEKLLTAEQQAKYKELVAARSM